MKKLDIINKKFSRLLVLEDDGTRTSFGRVKFKCLCDCGEIIHVIGTNLKNGNSKSCGCLQKELASKRLFQDGRASDPHYGRRLYLKNTYGITLENFFQLYNDQKYKCKICDSALDTNISKKFLNIDHCHITGKIRGILCSNCNVGIGCFNDNVELLYKAANYLNDSKK